MDLNACAWKLGCESNDPNFTAKAADVVGLYVAPPEKAMEESLRSRLWHERRAI